MREVLEIKCRLNKVEKIILGMFFSFFFPVPMYFSPVEDSVASSMPHVYMVHLKLQPSPCSVQRDPCESLLPPLAHLVLFLRIDSCFWHSHGDRLYPSLVPCL